MSDPVTPVSPTGTAVLPQALLKVAATLVGVAALALSILPSLPDAPWIKTATAVATAVVGLGALLGISSQGIRQTETAAAAKVTDVATALEKINK